MMTLDILCARFTALNPDDLRRWIAEGHVRTDRAADDLVFTEIDVERVRLILELRDLMQVNEEALPIVLQELPKWELEDDPSMEMIRRNSQVVFAIDSIDELRMLIE